MAYTINYNPFDSYDSLYTNFDKNGIYNPDAYPLLLKSPEHKYFNAKDFLSKITNKEESNTKTDYSSFFTPLFESAPDSNASPATEEIRAEFVSPSEVERAPENVGSSEESGGSSPYPLTWSLTLVLDAEGVKYKVTSHQRTKKVGKAKNSWHGTLYAWDIVPASGVSWDQFKKLIYGNSKIISWLKQKRNINGMQRSYGIIDETREDIRRKTGGTGPHLHIGPDTYGVNMLEDYIRNPRLWGGTTKYINGGILIKKYANGDEIAYSEMYGKPFKPVFVSEAELSNAAPSLRSLSILDTNNISSPSSIELVPPTLNYNIPTGGSTTAFFTPTLNEYSPAGGASKSSITINNSSLTVAGPNGEVIDIPSEFIPKGFSKEDINRGLSVAYYLMKEGGFSAPLASAQIGVFLDENHCNPKSFNREEHKGKKGRGKKYATGPNGYGAGIGSWPGETKYTYLTVSGYSKDTKVESLPLDKQCWLIINAANKKESIMKPFYDILKTSRTLEEAMPAAFLITAGVNQPWKTLPTVADARRKAAVYERGNNATYGRSSYHSGSYDRRYKYAQQFLKLVDYITDKYGIK